MADPRVAFEGFMFLLADVEPEQRDPLRAKVKQIMQELIDQALR